MTTKKERPPIKKTCLNERKLGLKCNPVGYPDITANLAVSVVNNNPRFTVFTNVIPEGQEKQIILQAPMDATTFFMVLDTIKTIDRQPTETNYAFDNYNVRNGEKVIVSKTIVGKDKKGRIYLAISGGQHDPVCVFRFKLTSWHTLVDKHGKHLPEDKVSAMRAKNWATLIGNLVTTVIVKEYVPYVPPTK